MAIGAGAIGQFAIGQGNTLDAGTLSVTDLTTGSPVIDHPAFTNLGIDSYVKLLLHGDGTNNSTTIIDSSPDGRTVTASGDAKLTTSTKKFGTASITFDGTGDYVSTPDSADFALGAGDWTADCWFRRTGGDGTRRMLFGQGDSANTPSLLSFRLELFNTAPGNSLSVSVGRSGSPAQVRVTGATAVTDSNWHHAAVVRNGASILVFLDGVLDGSGSMTGGASDPVNDSTGSFAIGRAGDWDTFYWIGEIDEFRLSVGVARWTASFTPPTQAYGYDLEASALTTSSPSLDAPAATVFYALTASALTTSSPVLDTPVLSHKYAATASDLTTGSPALDNPAAAVNYTLTANDLTTGSPSLDTPAASVFHALTASDLTTGSPDLGTPPLSTGNQLTVTDLVTGSPALDSPAAAVSYALVASALAPASPVLDAPALILGLLAADLAPAAPDLGTPALADIYQVADLTTGSPDLDEPAAVVTYLANDLTTGSPDIDIPALGAVYYQLSVFDFETGSPDLDQTLLVTFLEAIDLQTSAPELGEPDCSHAVLPRAELLINLGDTLLDPIYQSMISVPARVFPVTAGLPAVDLLAINHTNGITVQFGIGVQTVRPAIDVRVRELSTYGVTREDMTGGQVMLWPDTPEQEVWNIETVFPRPGIWGEPSGELRLFLMDRQS